ncbi:hypothetical protein SAMN04487857_102364 [Pseudomonas sp. ok272]|nr:MULTISPECIES: hypothetical protein [unclassified Pseudomonas]SEM51011.1 hypothetical protein SAMN04487857_102364 [Pseudomonas sp. ok272]SFM22655.1 hypothetical protein SAMN04487858_101365 [Pseudomonas sp. ok602]
MTIIARNAKAMTEALHRQGFFLVADLPKRIRIQTRRGMLVARVS